MIVVQWVMIVLGGTWDKMVKFKWSRLIPKFRTEKYPLNNVKKEVVGWAPVVGLEFTWKMGVGVGVGLGLIDIWFGWPRYEVPSA